jgi:hypothetical protein
MAAHLLDHRPARWRRMISTLAGIHDRKSGPGRSRTPSDARVALSCDQQELGEVPTFGPRLRGFLIGVRENLTVAIPPPVTAADAQAAIERIAKRRRQIDDPNAWRLSDDPAEVLVYLRKYSGGVPRSVGEQDVLDGLTLSLRLWWLSAEAELWLLERGERLGVSRSHVGRRLGVNSRQGVPDRLRLAREKVSRLLGAPRGLLDQRADQHDQDEQAWLAAHRTEILEISMEAVSHRNLANDEAAEWLVDVARDWQERAVTPGSVQVLRFALAELEASPAAGAVDPGHPLRRLLLRWSRLYGSRPARKTWALEEAQAPWKPGFRDEP